MNKSEGGRGTVTRTFQGPVKELGALPAGATEAGTAFAKSQVFAPSDQGKPTPGDCPQEMNHLQKREIFFKFPHRSVFNAMPF